MTRKITTLLLAVVLLASCNQYEKTPSGIAYKITKGGSTQKLKNGQFLMMNFEFRLMPKDSILNTSYGHIPIPHRVDSARMGKYNFLEILPNCAPGDKFEFELSVDTLIKLGMVPPNDPSFKKGSKIHGKVDILKTFANEQDMIKAYQAEIETEKQKEITDLKAYAAKKGITTQSSPKGVLVQVTNPGEGMKADSGKQVMVMYTGYTMDGKVFDSNTDKTKPDHNQPIPVVIGAGSVIPGWEEGLKFFAKGGKGKILVPALLAYGPDGRLPQIPKYANLVFDIEVTDVTTPPPPAPAPKMQMPQMPQKK